MEALLLLLLFPVIWPFIAKRIWHESINWTEMLLQIGLVSLLVFIVYTLGTYGQTKDIEIWNGKIVSKDRDHGHYLRSYQCNCTTVYSGSGSSRTSTRVCQTCYEDRYTVKWWAKTTAGKNITFGYKDSSWKSVYNSPDPKAYVRCTVGEPAAIEHQYINYVQAVPESLFHDDRKKAEEIFKDKVPEYPRVFNYYKIRRVIGDAVPPDQFKALNNGLGMALRDLGPEKQANIIMIITEIDDSTYRYAVERAWLGGNKNDIVIFVGVDGKEITWVDIMTWAKNLGNELFHVTMRDGLLDIGEVDADKMVPFIEKTVWELYDRPQMADFENLKDEIDPPTWVIILSVIIAIGGSVGLTFIFHRVDVGDIVGEFARNIFRKNRRY